MRSAAYSYVLAIIVTIFIALLPVAASTKSTTCSVGYAWNGNNCQSCQAGQTSDGKGGGCTNCSPNYTSNGGGACYACADGYGSQSGGQCQQCQQGQFSKNGSGCQSCPDGYISNQGASSCSPCAPGYYSNTAHTSCQECSAGTFQDQSGQTKCNDCPIGYWQEKQHMTYCDICPCGTFKSSTRGTKCDSCGNGNNGVLLTSNQGATAQNQCFAPSGGQYTNSSNCAVSCPAGTFSMSGTATSCTTCPSNAVASAGSKTCTTCGTGTAPDATKASCTPTSTAKITRRQQKGAQVCATGFQSCPIPGRRGAGVTYECVDTSSDLTSCGGCPGSSEAIDCSAFDPVAVSTCVRGQCVHKCPRGYSMSTNGCRRNARRRRSSQAMYKRAASS